MKDHIFRKKFIFANIALFIGTVVTIFLKYEGSTYVQIFGIVVTGFLVSQAYVDSKKEDLCKEEEVKPQQ